MKKPKLQVYYQEKVNKELSKCTECAECLKVCPVYTNTFTIDQLNLATQQGTKEKTIKNFAWQCISCKRCIPVCPEHLNRLDMMIQLRSRFKAPYRFRRYIIIRGKTQSLPRLFQQLYTKVQQQKHRQAAPYMQGDLIQTDPREVLFYPGCYVHSPTTLQHTLTLLNKYNITYSILGGMSTCCGLPHLLQGKYNKAESNLKQLHDSITTSGHIIIISGCLECVEAIQLAAHLYKGNYTGQSIHDYLKTQLKIKPTNKKLGNTLLLKGCRTSGTQTLETQLQAITQQIHTKKGCCAHWGLNYQNSNKKLKEELQGHIDKNNIQTIICECLTCYEELKDTLKIPTKELIQLLEETQ